MKELQQSLEELQAAATEESYIKREIARYAVLLGVSGSPRSEMVRDMVDELINVAEAKVALLSEEVIRRRELGLKADRLEVAIENDSAAAQRFADLIERKVQLDNRVTQAKVRQRIAREVFDAASKARSNIVRRVFTDTLNQVWNSVFTRLAPSEGFIPSFAIPSATKKTFDIKFETTHRSGESGGPPQMMLSAGNLNTAALSLFLALHLAVEPVVPCLVLDDPVQAMDEVHVAQFAALIRTLSKQHGRQVIIAVHERELFDYLTLELSPAYEGDELLTIELGDRAVDEDRGITRHRWVPDVAIAS